MSVDAIAAVQKTTSVGLFLALPQAKHLTCKVMPNFLGWGMHRSILGGKPMASSSQKPRPSGVPEENVYTSMHWMIVVTYIVASAAIYLLISGAV